MYPETWCVPFFGGIWRIHVHMKSSIPRRALLSTCSMLRPGVPFDKLPRTGLSPSLSHVEDVFTYVTYPSSIGWWSLFYASTVSWIDIDITDVT